MTHNDIASLLPGDILEYPSLHIYLNKLNKHEKKIFCNHWNLYLPIKSLRLKKSFPQEKQKPGNIEVETAQKCLRRLK